MVSNMKLNWIILNCISGFDISPNGIRQKCFSCKLVSGTSTMPCSCYSGPPLHLPNNLKMLLFPKICCKPTGR